MPRRKKILETDSKNAGHSTSDSAPSRVFIYSVGRRKEAVSRVRVYKDGQGLFAVNQKDLKNYFSWPPYAEIASSPLKEFNLSKDFDVTVKVTGGGSRSQALSVRLGLARALLNVEPELKTRFRQLGFLSRDPRVKERKKPGLKRARRAPQWQKR